MKYQYIMVKGPRKPATMASSPSLALTASRIILRRVGVFGSGIR